MNKCSIAIPDYEIPHITLIPLFLDANSPIKQTSEETHYPIYARPSQNLPFTILGIKDKYTLQHTPSRLKRCPPQPASFFIVRDVLDVWSPHHWTRALNPVANLRRTMLRR